MRDTTTSILTVSHGLTRDGQPLATVEGLPGAGAEMTPAQLRGLAQALQQAARDCEQLPIRRGARHCVRSYGEVAS